MDFEPGISTMVTAPSLWLHAARPGELSTTRTRTPVTLRRFRHSGSDGHDPTWATADPSGYVTSASGNDFKVGAEIKAGATVTVSVPATAPGHAGLEYGQSWSYSPAQAVTFHACPDTDTAFIGGFHVEGRQCVPLDIAVGGAPPTRVVVSFFNGPCPA